MRKIHILKPTLYLCGLLIAVLLGSGLFFKSIILPTPVTPEEKQPEVLGQALMVSASPSPSPSPSPSTKALVKPFIKPSPSSTPAPSASPAAPVQTGTPASPSPSTTASPTPTPSGSASPSPSPSPTQSIVNVQVQGSGFTVEISGDLNVCQVMQRARDQGKISSLTLDDSYMSSMNSQYVREMNGMSNNWTFKVNGNSPLGCSLYQVKPEDLIVWKFGQ